MTTPDKLLETPEQYKKWLEAQPEGFSIGQACDDRCPLSTYLSSMLGSIWFVDGFNAYQSGTRIPLPTWAKEHADWIDYEGWVPIYPEKALSWFKTR